MYAVQYIAIVIILAMMVYSLGKYGKKEFDWRDFLFWETLLVVMLIVAAFPIEISMAVKGVLGLGRGLDSLFAVAIGLSYILIFRVYMAIDRTEREITELTRKIAIELEEINDTLKKLGKGD